MIGLFTSRCVEGIIFVTPPGPSGQVIKRYKFVDGIRKKEFYLVVRSGAHSCILELIRIFLAGSCFSCLD